MGGWTGRGVLLATGLLMTSLGFAQAAPVQSLRFTVFATRALTDVALPGQGSAAPQKLRFNPTTRSAPYEYAGPTPLRFVDPTTRAVVAEAVIPAGLRDALLIFTPLDPVATGAGKLRYQVAVLDDGVSRHAPGGLAVVNLSGLSLRGQVNDQAITLRSGLNPTLAIGRGASLRFTSVVNQRTFQAYAGSVTLGTGERALLLLFPPFYPGSREVQHRMLIDRPLRSPEGKR